jgi:hypothetical protein
MGPGDPGFLAKLASFQADVVAHAEREEREEHPLLQREDQDRLRSLAGAFRAAESAAPTHPHPHGPESAAGNMILGPAVAVADRARDAVRSAMAKIGR